MILETNCLCFCNFNTLLRGALVGWNQKQIWISDNTSPDALIPHLEMEATLMVTHRKETEETLATVLVFISCQLWYTVIINVFGDGVVTIII